MNRRRFFMTAFAAPFLPKPSLAKPVATANGFSTLVYEAKPIVIDVFAPKCINGMTEAVNDGPISDEIARKMEAAYQNMNDMMWRDSYLNGQSCVR